MRYRVMLLGLVVPALLLAQQPNSRCRGSAPAPTWFASMPTSRKTTRRSPISSAEDFAVFEDDKPQNGRELRADYAPAGRSRRRERRDPTNVRDMRQQVADAARVFTLFFDRFYVPAVGFVSTRRSR